MNEPAQNFDPDQVTLFCPKLNIEIEFRLGSGSFARIGSAEEMEISLPIVGVGAQEVRLDRDISGNLIAASGQSTYLVTEKTGIWIGPHHFQLKDSRSRSPIIRQSIPPVRVPLHPFSEHRKAASQKRSVWERVGRTGRVIVGALLALVSLLALVVFSNGKKDRQSHSTSNSQATPSGADVESVKAGAGGTETAGSNRGREVVDWSQIVTAVKQSVFKLNVLNEHGHPYASGTAFSVGPSGYLITNAHVIKGAENFEAVTEQGAAFKIKNVRHYDEDNDLAVLEIDAKDLPSLKIASGNKLRVGEPVAVYGSPQGMQGSLSEGVISAFRRGSDLKEPQLGELIQITAPISSGSSGSPVLNTEGAVIGVATLLLKSSQNLNFAVPISVVEQLLGQSPMEPGEFENRNHSTLSSVTSNDPAEIKLPGNRSTVVTPPGDPEFVALEESKQASNWLEALRIAKSLVSKYPESYTPHFEMAYAASELSLHDLALRSYQEAIAKNPQSSAAWNNLGGVYGRLNKSFDAEKALERAVEVDSTNTMALANLVRRKIVNKKWDDAGHVLVSLGQIDKPASAALLNDLLAIFSKSVPEGLKRTAKLYRASFPVVRQDPKSLGKRLAARFLSFGAGDNPDAELRSYADIVEPYFGESRKDAGSILKDLLDYRQKWPARSYDLIDFESAKLNASGDTLVARYSFRYQVAGHGKQRKGTMKQEATFRRISDEFWVVKGVRTLSSREE